MSLLFDKVNNSAYNKQYTLHLLWKVFLYLISYKSLTLPPPFNISKAIKASEVHNIHMSEILHILKSANKLFQQWLFPFCGNGPFVLFVGQVNFRLWLDWLRANNIFSHIWATKLANVVIQIPLSSKI